jgi:hypothetical protein
MLGHHRVVSGLRRSSNASQHTHPGTALQAYEATLDNFKPATPPPLRAQDLVMGASNVALLTPLSQPTQTLGMTNTQSCAAPAYSYAETHAPALQSQPKRTNIPGQYHPLPNPSSMQDSMHPGSQADFMSRPKPHATGLGVSGGCKDEASVTENLCRNVDALDQFLPKLLQENRMLKEALKNSATAHQDNLMQFA